MANVGKLIGTESPLEVGQKINEIIEKGVGGGHKIFDVVQKDHILTFEESKGLVAFGDYAYKTGSEGTRYGYPEFYDKCLQEYNEAEDVTLYTTRDFSVVDTSTDGTSLILRENFNAGEGNANVGNFATTRYLLRSGEVPSLQINEPFVFNITTGDDVSKEQTIACFDKDYNGFLLSLEGGKLHFWGSTVGTKWDITEKTGTSTLIVNTTYTVTVNWDGATYTVDLQVEGGAKTTEISVTNANTLFIESNLSLGLTSFNTGLPFLGTINLIQDNKPVTYHTNAWYPYNSICVKKHSNKHVFYDIAEVDSIDYIYNKTGKAWLYGVDTTNERVRIPRNDGYFMNSVTDEIGKMMNAGLPDHLHPLTAAVNGGSYVDYDDGNGKQVGNKSIFTNNASPSNSIYGNSDTVQTDAVKLMGYICVGNTETEVASTEVTEVTTSENDTLPLGFNDYFVIAPNNVSYLKYTEQFYSADMYETFFNWLVNNKNNKYVKDVTDTQITPYDFIVDETNRQFKLPKVSNKSDCLGYEGTKELQSGWFTTYKPTVNTVYRLETIELNGLQDVLYEIKDKQTGEVVESKTVQIGWQGIDVDIITHSVFVKHSQAFAVQAPSTTGIYIHKMPVIAEGDLYFKVGNAVANQELIDVGTLTETVNNKIDINSGYVDGQWVGKTAVLTQSVKAGVTEIDMSEYLPQDNYQYEVILVCSYYKTSTSKIQIYSDIIPQPSSVSLIVADTGRVQSSYIYIPIGTERKLYQYLSAATTSSDTGQYGIEALGYRRVGKNL